MGSLQGLNNGVLLVGQQALWEKSAPIGDPRQPRIRALADQLVTIFTRLRSSRPEIRCLGAPQIGQPLRLCVVRLQSDSSPLVLVNPWLAEASLENAPVWESCASIPDLRFEISRFTSIKIEFVDLAGVGRTLSAEGEDAATLQHAIDHFNGFLVSDRLADPRRIEHRLARLQVEPGRYDEAFDSATGA